MWILIQERDLRLLVSLCILCDSAVFYLSVVTWRLQLTVVLAELHTDGDGDLPTLQSFLAVGRIDSTFSISPLSLLEHTGITTSDKANIAFVVETKGVCNELVKITLHV